MTDHYRVARDLLVQRDVAAAHLAAEHAKSERDRNAKRVAELYDERNTALQLAKVHAQLAVAQAITDQGISR